MKSRMTLMGAAGILAVLLMACGGDEAGSADVVATPVPTAQQDDVPVAMNSAYIPLAWAPSELWRGADTLTDYGYEVTWNEVSSPLQLVQSFAQDQLDVIPQSVGIAANMYAEGVPFEIIDTGLTVYGQVIVPAESDIQAPEDLAGKRVASSTGTSTHAFVVALLDQVHDVDLNADAELVNAATPPDQANLLTGGEVDAAIMWSPLAETLTVDGEYRIVARQSEMWQEANPDSEPMIHIVYLARPDYLEQHPRVVADIRAATQDVVELWDSDPQQVQDIYASVSELPPPVIQHAYETGPVPLSGLEQSDTEQIKQQWRLLDEVGYFEESPDLSDEALDALFTDDG